MVNIKVVIEKNTRKGFYRELFKMRKNYKTRKNNTVIERKHTSSSWKG